MKPKTLWLLLGLTAVVVVAAVFASRGRGPTRADGEQELLFAELSERVNDVAEIHVVGADHETTVRHREDGWGLVQKDFYPAKVERVKETVLKLADLPILEPKTSKPENFGALGLADPGEEGSPAVRVVLRDGAGEEIAGLVVGEANYRGGSPSVFVRRPGEDQTYECEGRLTIDADPLTWIDREVLKLENDRVRAVEVRHADGEVLRAEREAKGSRNFTVLDVPEGRELSYEGAGSSVATALSYLRLDDVRPAGEVDFEAEPVATTAFRCYDGLVVAVETARFEERVWARIDARYEEPPATEAEAPEGEEAPEDAASPEGEDEDAEETDGGGGSLEAERRDAARRESRTLQRNLDPWAYQLPEFKAETLTKRMADLLADEEPEEPPEIGGGELVPPVDDAPGDSPPAADDAADDAGEPAEDAEEPPDEAGPEGDPEGEAAGDAGGTGEEPAPAGEEDPADEPGGGERSAR